MGTVSDVEVERQRGTRVLLTTERGEGGGVLHLRAGRRRAIPTLVTSVPEPNGLHTGTFATIGGRDFVFAARNPGDPALVMYDVTGALQ